MTHKTARPARTRLAPIALALLFSAAGSAQANLLTNGGFENGTYGSGFDTEMSAGFADMTGWTIAGNSTLSWLKNGNGFNLGAQAGDKFLDLTGLFDVRPYATTLSQTIATTAGTTYQLSFQLGSSSTYGRPATLLASAGGTSQSFSSGTSVTGVSDWEARSMTFTATGASTTIAFLATSSNVYVGLDAVDVTAIGGSGGGSVPPVSAIPEPETYALMLAGLGVVGWGARRRRSA